MSETETAFDDPDNGMKPAPEPKNKGGRPADRTMSFGARLLALRLACTDRHARRLITEEGVEHLMPKDWFVVGYCIDIGLRRPDDFEAELRVLNYL